jgi:leucyl-tRNA synthetase
MGSRRDNRMSETVKRSYRPHELEEKWGPVWEEEGLYLGVDEDEERPRFYALDMFPYPSGDLHMGHAEVYAIGDAVARYRRMQGHNVLHPIGWDAFGLPAENAALKRAVHPKEWTYRNIEQQRRSFKRYGMSFDWRRQFNTCDPDYYRWTQWLFLKLFERGLAYRKLAAANWCPKDRTVLANEQVVGGRCERCDTPVVRKDLTQWFFKITDYADRLLEDMEQLPGWTDRVLTMQRNWIGRSRGAEIEFEIAETEDRVTVFTTRPDTLWGVTFLVFAPEHPMVLRLAEAGGTHLEVKDLLDRLQRMHVSEREAAGIREGVDLGVLAVNPVNGEHVPCFVAPYVLLEYGTGAVMGVPGHDQRDFEFARAHDLQIHVVIQPAGASVEPEEMTEAWPHEGVMVRSGPFDGTPSPESIAAVVEWLEREGKGRAATSYRLRDWLISRQRYWGAPIPIVHCAVDGEVPVPEEELPVLLPEDVDFSPTGESPLSTHRGFVSVACPRCGGEARRETDTMDTFVDSSWYFLRYCSPHDDARAFDPEAVARWMPVDHYTGGINHAVLHLLYSRFVTKVLHDMGLVQCREPFMTLLNQGMVIMGGSAMSKSRGNLVVFADELNRFGSDVIRVTMLFAGPVDLDVDWAAVSPSGVQKWLGKVWRVVWDVAARAPAGDGSPASGASDLRRATARAIKGVTADFEHVRFNVAVAKLMTLTTEIQRAIEGGAAAGDLREAAQALTLLLAPMAPFVTEELWREALGHEASVHVSPWPVAPEELTREERVVLVIQVDGKVRDRITVQRDATEQECREAALTSDRVRRAMDGKEVLRTVVKPPRLVNIVTRA